MNKLIVTLLLLVGSGMFSGCIFGRRTHASAVAAHADTVNKHIDTVVAVTPVNTRPDSNIAVHTDTVKNGTLVTRDTTKNIGVPDSAAIAANNLKTQQLAFAAAIWHRPMQYTTFEGKAKMHYDGVAVARSSLPTSG